MLDSSRVFMWFESLADLAAHIVNHLPDDYDFDAEQLADYQASVTPLAQRLQTGGFSPGLLDELNAAIKDNMVIDWWGNFDELVAGDTEFARQLVSSFLGDKEVARPVVTDELDDFVEYLRSCC